MRTAKETWEAAKGALQVQVSRSNFETWLKETVGITHQGDRFLVGTPNAFAKEWLEKRLLSLVTNVLMGILGEEVKVQFQVCSGPLVAEGPCDPLQPKPRPPAINQRFTFGSFVVGDSNRLAYAAALGVAEQPGQAYNPLFIHGGSGLGKTHLAHAIGNEASENGFRVIYASSEQFTNEFVCSIKEKRMEEFRHKFRSADVMVLDDVQFMIGKPQTQETLFHTFNDLYNSDRQLVITGDRAPKAMTSVDISLCSRFGSGLVAEVGRPDLETRLAILRGRCEQQHVFLDEEVLDYIAARCTASVRDLHGAFNLVVAYATLSKERPSVELARHALGDSPSSNGNASVVTPALILNTVADYFDISPDALKAKNRDHKLVLARQIAIYLVREKTNCPLQEIGRLLGGRDHSTIVRGYQRIAGLLDSDRAVQNNVSQIMKKLAL
jgi:chromosomal replication initiator protein